METRPCPFGCKAEFEMQYNETNNQWYIECQQCGATGPHDYDSIDARKQWNKRVEP